MLFVSRIHSLHFVPFWFSLYFIFIFPFFVIFFHINHQVNCVLSYMLINFFLLFSFPSFYHFVACFIYFVFNFCFFIFLAYIPPILNFFAFIFIFSFFVIFFILTIKFSISFLSSDIFTYVLSTLQFCILLYFVFLLYCYSHTNNQVFESLFFYSFLLFLILYFYCDSNQVHSFLAESHTHQNFQFKKSNTCYNHITMFKQLTSIVVCTLKSFLGKLLNCNVHLNVTSTHFLKNHPTVEPTSSALSVLSTLHQLNSQTDNGTDWVCRATRNVPSITEVTD